MDTFASEGLGHFIAYVGHLGRWIEEAFDQLARPYSRVKWAHSVKTSERTIGYMLEYWQLVPMLLSSNPKMVDDTEYMIQTRYGGIESGGRPLQLSQGNAPGTCRLRYHPLYYAALLLHKGPIRHPFQWRDGPQTSPPAPAPVTGTHASAAAAAYRPGSDHGERAPKRRR